jgi:hypothetical protein
VADLRRLVAEARSTARAAEILGTNEGAIEGALTSGTIPERWHAAIAAVLSGTWTDPVAVERNAAAARAAQETAEYLARPEPPPAPPPAAEGIVDAGAILTTPWPLEPNPRTEAQRLYPWVHEARRWAEGVLGRGVVRAGGGLALVRVVRALSVPVVVAGAWRWTLQDGTQYLLVRADEIEPCGPIGHPHISWAREAPSPWSSVGAGTQHVWIASAPEGIATFEALAHCAPLMFGSWARRVKGGR